MNLNPDLRVQIKGSNRYVDFAGVLGPRGRIRYLTRAPGPVAVLGGAKLAADLVRQGLTDPSYAGPQPILFDNIQDARKRAAGIASVSLRDSVSPDEGRKVPMEHVTFVKDDYHVFDPGYGLSVEVQTPAYGWYSAAIIAAVRPGVELAATPEQATTLPLSLLTEDSIRAIGGLLRVHFEFTNSA